MKVIEKEKRLKWLFKKGIKNTSSWIFATWLFNYYPNSHVFKTQVKYFSLLLIPFLSLIIVIIVIKIIIIIINNLLYCLFDFIFDFIIIWHLLCII